MNNFFCRLVQLVGFFFTSNTEENCTFNLKTNVSKTGHPILLLIEIEFFFSLQVMWRTS